jgi:hypothetical protein
MPYVGLCTLLGSNLNIHAKSQILMPCSDKTAFKSVSEKSSEANSHLLSIKFQEFTILVFIVPVGSIRMQKHKNRQIANTIYLFIYLKTERLVSAVFGHPQALIEPEGGRQRPKLVALF